MIHFSDLEGIHLNDLFKQDTDRKENYLLALDELQFDYSKNRITPKTIELLVELTKELGLKKAIDSLFSGEKINTTEDRAVLHTALREFEDKGQKIDNVAIYPLVSEARKKIKSFSDEMISGKWKGHTGKAITDVVNIGIGGSDLGPKMVVEALRFYGNHLNMHFVSNVDGDDLNYKLRKLNPETTLFIVVSKTFTTVETLTNANSCRKWFLQKAPAKAIENHFVAVSTNMAAVKDFGINPKNTFPMWNWIGGRFSMWNSVGLAIALAIGYENFEHFLRGANTADQHFKNEEFGKNIPVMMALLSIWYTNFFGVTTEAILPYAESLNELVAYLQQLFMESNGKSVDRNTKKITYKTGNIIFGSTGSNAQHSFMQHVHQGRHLIPVDFIGFKKSLYGDNKHHDILMANFNAQSQALQEGKSEEAVHLDMKFNGNSEAINALIAYRVFEGNRVSNSFLFDKLTPYNLGMLIGLYEHKVFVQGVVWNINSFDQFGVELGKEMARKQ